MHHQSREPSVPSCDKVVESRQDGRPMNHTYSWSVGHLTCRCFPNFGIDFPAICSAFIWRYISIAVCCTVESTSYLIRLTATSVFAWVFLKLWSVIVLSIVGRVTVTVKVTLNSSIRATTTTLRVENIAGLTLFPLLTLFIEIEIIDDTFLYQRFSILG